MPLYECIENWHGQLKRYRKKGLFAYSLPALAIKAYAVRKQGHGTSGTASKRRKKTPHFPLDPHPTPTHRDAAGILGGLALLVVEVSGHGDHGGCARLAQCLLRYSLELDEHHGRDLLGRHLLLRSQPGDLHLGAAVATVHHSEGERLGVVADNLRIGFGIFL